MSTLTYINENGKEVSLNELEQTCADLCDHISGLKDIALSRNHTVEETGVFMVMATSLDVICNRLFEVKPEIK